MKKVVLLLDGSAAMNNNTDMTPTRLLALNEPVSNLVKGFLQASPLSVLSLVVMRDGVAHRLTPLTSDLTSVLRVMEKSYFLFGGSGHVSIENGLNVAMSELTARKRYDQQNGEILLISGSLSTVDPGNVLDTIQQAADRGIKCHVLGLNGASHVLQQLSSRTGGAFLCPITKGQVPALVHDLGQCIAVRKKGMPQRGKRSRGGKEGAEEEGAGNQQVVLIGLPQKISGKLTCPQCSAPLPSESTPTTCAICCLLITEETKLRVSALQQAPPTLAPTRFVAARSVQTEKNIDPGEGEDFGGNSEETRLRTAVYNCFGCDAVIPPSRSKSTTGPVATTVNAIHCTSCEELYCQTCANFVRQELFVCPGCF